MSETAGRRKRDSNTLDDSILSPKHIKLIPEKDLLDVQEDSGSQNDAVRVTPFEMTKIIKDLKCISGEKKQRFSTFSSFDGVQLPDGIDSETLRADLRRYFREAVLYSSITLKAALNVLDDYLHEGRSIALHPLFPKKPLNAFRTFQKTKVSSFNGSYFGLVSTIAAQWKDQNYAEERLAAEEEARRSFKEYAEQLVQFRDSAGCLLEEQEVYIEKQIASALKLSKGDDKSEKRTPRKENKDVKKQTSKTPFDLFVLSFGNKYNDLDPEKKEKKLRKKFSKLSEEELLKYENLSRLL